MLITIIECSKQREAEDKKQHHKQFLDDLEEDRRVVAGDAERRHADRKKYGCELRDQMDYNRRQRMQEAEEMDRLVERQGQAEVEYEKKIKEMFDDLDLIKKHPLRIKLETGSLCDPVDPKFIIQPAPEPNFHFKVTDRLPR